MAKKTSKKGSGAGIAALAAAGAAAAAGYYFYASKDAKQNRKIAAAWARDLKREVVAEANKLKKIDRADVMKIVDNAARAYASARSIEKSALNKASQELKKNWKHLTAEAVKAQKTAVKKKAAVRAVAKKARA